MSLVHIVLVNWNGHRDTMECLESLLRLRENNFCVTVCDNGSTDGSIQKLTSWLGSGPTEVVGSQAVWANIENPRSHKPTFEVVGLSDAAEPTKESFVRVVDARQNLGFAGGSNVGIRRALSDPECEFVWLLNNDTVAGPKALSALLSKMREEPDLSVCGSTLLFYHDPDKVQGLAGRFNVAIARGEHLGYLGRATALPPREQVEASLSYVMGASMFVRREVFERTGGLSEDYFLYYEEQDLAQRLLPRERQGWAPDSTIFHKEGGSIGTSSQSRPSDTSLYYLQINTLRFYRKFYPLLLPVALARVAREAGSAWRRKDRNAVRISGLAVRDFATGAFRKGPIKLGETNHA